MKARFLRPLYEQTGGWASLYLDADRSSKEAADAVALRWRAAREQLAAEGADPATLTAMDAVVGDPDGAAPGRAVFARGAHVALSTPLPSAPAEHVARAAPLPHVLPLLAALSGQVPHLRVAARRDGGEIVTLSAAEPEQGPAEAAEPVRGRDWPLHKVRGGGWSHARYQRSAEEAWDENAKELATRVADAARQAPPRYIVISGDVRARTLLLRHLGSALRERAVVIDKELPADSPQLEQAADHAIAAALARETRHRFLEWRGLLARGGAVEGLADTVAALRDGLAADVFAAPDLAPDTPAWIGPGWDMALSEAELRERGVAQPGRDRADAAIARGVICTDASLWFLPETAGHTADGDAPDLGSDLGGPPPAAGICATLRTAAA
jgi:hypothetical protein